MSGCVLALDFGTQGLKGLLLDEAGDLAAMASHAYGFALNRGGQMEQSPSAWCEALSAVLTALRCQDQERFRRILAIGITGQMHGVVALDREGKPLGNVIVWCDTRAEREAVEMRDALPTALRERLENPFVSAYTAPKLLWMRAHQPEQFTKTHKILWCKDYMGYLLTGEMHTDPSDASGSLLYDFHSRDWCGEALAALEISRSLLPDILSPEAAGGRVSHAAAVAFGLPEGIPVAVGAGDLACSVLGSGVSGDDQILVNLGTAGQVLTLHPSRVSRDPGGYLFNYLSKDECMTLFAIPSAAYCLRWFLERVATDIVEHGEIDAAFARLCDLAATCPPGADGLLFAPYLSGTGSPYFDARARGAFVGLTAGHGRETMARAIMEGVCFGIRDCLSDAHRFAQVLFTGGGAKSALWGQILSDVLAREVICPDVLEAAGAGAGLLAARVIGMPKYARRVDARRICPDDGRSRIYQDQSRRFKRLYGLLSAIVD